MIEIRSHLNKINTKLSNLIKKAYVALTSKDDKDYSTAQINYYGKTTYIQTLYPYGFSANAPLNTLILLMNVMGQEENLIGIPYCAKERFKNLKSGEVVIGSPISGSYLKFKSDGDIEIICKKDLKITVTNESNITTKEFKISTDNMQTTANNMQWINGGNNITFGLGDYIVTCTNVKLNAHVDLGIGGAKIARKGDQVKIGSSVGTIIGGGDNTST
jgi:hypothetical protein